MRKIAVLSQKGGTGKTTTSINLAHGLALMGKSVLLVDSDPQNTVAIVFNVNPEKTLCDLILKRRASIVKVREKLHIISSGGKELVDTEAKLMKKFGKEYKLKKNLSHLDGVDYVIVDCAPSINLINVNVLTYCDEVIIPVSMDFLSQIGANQILGMIDSVRKSYNKNLDILGVLAVYYNEKRRISLDTIAILKDYFKEKLFNTYIREDVNLKEAPSFMKTIFEYAPDSWGAQDYFKLANEVDSK
jgi:chromosome partitioning protein